jgi:hypothetical protein
MIQAAAISADMRRRCGGKAQAKQESVPSPGRAAGCDGNGGSDEVKRINIVDEPPLYGRTGRAGEFALLSTGCLSSL